MRWGKIGALGFTGGMLVGMGIECISAGLRVIAQDIREYEKDRDAWEDCGATAGPSHGMPQTSDGNGSSSQPSSQPVSSSSLITTDSYDGSQVSYPGTGNGETAAESQQDGYPDETQDNPEVRRA